MTFYDNNLCITLYEWVSSLYLSTFLALCYVRSLSALYGNCITVYVVVVVTCCGCTVADVSSAWTFNFLLCFSDFLILSPLMVLCAHSVRNRCSFLCWYVRCMYTLDCPFTTVMINEYWTTNRNFLLFYVLCVCVAGTWTEGQSKYGHRPSSQIMRTNISETRIGEWGKK